MSTDVISIDAKPRERTGSRYSRRLRASGGLPAVVYGHKQDPESVTLDAKQVVRQISEGHKLFKISMGSSEDTVLLKDIQYDHLGTDVIHVDFERVDLTEQVEVNLPVHLKGDAIGLKTAGAILIHPTSEIEVRCKVSDIVEHIDVDISGLDVGQALHASDVPLPPGFELLTEPEAVLAAIQVKAEEEEEGEAGEAEEGAAEPEVLSERKEDKDSKKEESEG